MPDECKLDLIGLTDVTCARSLSRYFVPRAYTITGTCAHLSVVGILGEYPHGGVRGIHHATCARQTRSQKTLG